MSTSSYLIRRVLQAVVVIVIVTIVVFGLLHALPGGPARGILGPQATAQQIASFNHEQGLDKPLPVQYFYYLNQLLHGDLGTSYTLNEPVSQLITERLAKTLVLTALSAIVGLVLAIPLGMWQAVRRNKPIDYVITTLSFIAYSTPVYFLGLILVLVFSQVLPWFPSQAPQGDTLAQVFSEPQALVLPVIAGAASMIAVFSRYMRAATLENLSEDYVRTARAGGSRSRAILWRHVFRNSLTPVVAMLGYYVPVLFGGALVVEQLFNYPGMGLLFWTAAQSSDYPVLLGCVLVIAAATVVGTLLADIVQRIIDPRVKAGRA
ncbi:MULTISPECIES: ABC transporter permease [unclassified Streptomyces]|uniref:ABC transporter permease n=1 Tax=unclassified Streptomyces TaxID=2593676 RepID=UPI00225A138B|nr:MULTISPECIES: ABC transporter permease [unclassified Streptomyces]WSP54827.1 ABC transporter permease [Streptomyces sp. NBC_01241]WSU24494.1 ABC transporter permease [Streptomyces sp. NBC_01108]MCX4786398.1 ABC transporter permease [Streptomyces sp. NBC_01221]MCX4797747.1 ABC transporter permease [Streptomyces sp. NBC_01242]WSJ39030.1 ABC transporter permease [Streptomyces sp. NBC_01321]